MAANGQRDRDIAAALFVSEHTIEAHLSHAYDKLAVSGRGGVLARLFTEQFLDGFTES